MKKFNNNRERLLSFIGRHRRYVIFYMVVDGEIKIFSGSARFDLLHRCNKITLINKDELEKSDKEVIDAFVIYEEKLNKALGRKGNSGHLHKRKTK